MAGVHAILTEEDLPEHDPLDETCVTNEPLYEGQAILAVAADNEWIAADAIEKIKVDLEPLPFVLDPLDSLRPGGPNARRDGNVIVRETPSEPGKPPKNVVKEQKWTAEAFAAAGGARLPDGDAHVEWAIGDVDKGFAEADFVIDGRSTTSPTPTIRSSRARAWRTGRAASSSSTHRRSRSPSRMR